jgi:hypothetical protein
VKLSDHDRASIVGSVVRNIFKSGSTYEGKYFVLGDNLQPKWIPKVVGYDLALVTRKEIESSKTSLNYYVLWLRPLKNSVHVTVHLYDSQTDTFPRETKIIRDAGHARRVADELKIDIESYHAHPMCKRLLAFVFDPHSHIVDPNAITKDLSGVRIKGDHKFDVQVIVRT